ncbi:MAG: pyridoxal-phosphate dependent enzyme [Anaerolineales bacterium]
MPPFACSSCGRPYPAIGFPFRCPTCGGVFDYREPIAYVPEAITVARGGGLARFRKSYPLPPDAPWVSLGEGDSPLVPAVVEGRTIHFKCEFMLPTGSFKDRGTVVLVNALVAAGVAAAVEDSSGNAGASFAAYAGLAGIRARVVVPDSASPTKLAQIRAYGAEVVRVLGPRSNASEVVLRIAAGGTVYASHAYQPHGLAGMATAAFEIYEQLGRAPGSVVLPVGQGTLLLGLARGFAALQSAGRIERTPVLVGVQAMSCAPIWAVSRAGAAGLRLMGEGETIAEGIRIRTPIRGDAVLAAVEGTGGWIEAVEEEAIAVGRQALARLGFWVEPTSAVVWPALRAGVSRMAEPVVAVLSGSGYKHPQL